MTTANYSDPLLAAQRALHRASECAAEQRYEEAIAHLECVRMHASAAGRVMRELEATAGTDG
jgi:hypothetical protein